MALDKSDPWPNLKRPAFYRRIDPEMKIVKPPALPKPVEDDVAEFVEEKPVKPKRADPRTPAAVKMVNAARVTEKVAKLAKAEDEGKTVVVGCRFEANLVGRLKGYMVRHGIANLSAAVRELIEGGLDREIEK